MFRFLLYRVNVAVCLAFVLAVVPAQSKPIFLRNFIFSPNTSSTNEPTKSLATTSTSNLYLIQFRQPVKSEWWAKFKAAGIELLQYVPEDTYIARLKRITLDTVQKLPFVEWAGVYHPEYKIQKSLSVAPAAKAANSPIPINVLLAPDCSTNEVSSVQASFVSLRGQSSFRFGTILRGQVSRTQLDALAQSDAVLWIESAPPMKLFDEVSSSIVAGSAGPNELYTQSLGYDGSDVTVSVADSGLDNGDSGTMHPDLFGRTPDFFYYGNLTDASDEHGHGTHVAGIIAGNGSTGETDENGFLYGLGVAPGADIIAQRIFDSVGGYEEPAGGFEQLTRDATRAGAVIGSNSWGDDTQGRYDTSAMEFDALVRDADALKLGDQPYILEFSAGNAGPGSQTVGSPAVAKNVIATGASENDREDLFIYTDGPDTMADFSSRGPCEDGRIKPDIVAPGTWIASLKSASATDENAWAPIDNYYFYMGGTSQAGPHASGAAAVFVQYYRQTVTNTTPSPALVKAALINSATDMNDGFSTAAVPNMDEGWGRIDLPELIGSTRRYDFLDQTVLLQTSQVYERHVVVAAPDESLKVTLAYTDVPGFPGAIPALVNDLDLEVVGPTEAFIEATSFWMVNPFPTHPAQITSTTLKASISINRRQVIIQSAFELPTLRKMRVPTQQQRTRISPW